jgi:hypothetical protein
VRRIALLAAAALAAIAVHAPAGATVITTDYTISGTGSGAMSLDFDTSTSAYSLASLSFTLGSVTFTQTDVSVAPLFSTPPPLQIGGNLNGIGAVAPGTDDFTFLFDPALASQSVNLLYTTTAATGFGSFFDGTVTLTQATQVTPGLPEPATWAMMLLGFGAVGLALRRRRRIPAIA